MVPFLAVYRSLSKIFDVSRSSPFFDCSAFKALEQRAFRRIGHLPLFVALLSATVSGCIPHAETKPRKNPLNWCSYLDSPGRGDREGHTKDLVLDPYNFLDGWEGRLAEIRETELESAPLELPGSTLSIDSERQLMVRPQPGTRLPKAVVTFNDGTSTKESVIFDPAWVNATGLGSLRLSPSKDYLAVSFSTTLSASGGYHLALFPINQTHTSKVVSGHVHSFEWSSDSRYLYFSTESDLRPNRVDRYDTKDESVIQVFQTQDTSVELLLRPASEPGAVMVLESSPSGDSLIRIFGSHAQQVVFPHIENQRILVRSAATASLFAVDDPAGGSRAISGDKIIYRPSDGYSITGLDSISDYFIFVEKRGARERLVWLNRSDGSLHRSGAEFTPGSFSLVSEQSSGSSRYTFEFESLCKPRARYEVSFGSNSIAKVHEYPIDSLVRNEFSKCSESILLVPEKDGTEIEVAVARPKSDFVTPLRGLVLRSYGAYGVSPLLAAKNENSLLLRSGIGLAVSFIRGGNDYGSQSRSKSVGPAKISTIDDLIRSSQTLESIGIVAPGKIVLEAESAGGAIAASAFLEYPDLFAGMMLAAPVLDLEGLLRNEELAGRAREIEEWGDPKNAIDLVTIRKVSPIQRIKNRHYPPIIITFGTEDRIVPFWSIENWILAFHCRSDERNVLVLNPLPHYGHSRELTIGERFESEAKRQQFIFEALSAEKL